MDEKKIFKIRDDSMAEWAVKQIKEAVDERDRLCRLIDDQIYELRTKRDETIDRCDNGTAFLKYALNEYMNTVKCKSTKTQSTYQLLTGKLVRKHQSTDYKRDDAALLPWLAEHHPEWVKTTQSVDWKAVKGALDIVNPEDFDEPIICIGSTGELVDGVSIEMKPESFDIKFE